MAGSTFGKLFRVTTFGESHGPAVGCIVDGCPAGVPCGKRTFNPLWIDAVRDKVASPLPETKPTRSKS